jgi:lipopolysaccharide/colanic/teichoic acid biosynthesis glycosyltransferase/carbonic anhydrase/acetyltransferase-like protein (isoleucine patch superfamily)
LDEKGLGARLLSAGSSVVEVPKPLSVRSYEEILASHQRVLSKEVSGLVLSGREIDQGIWLSRNVSLHPTAILNAPVYVSENCRIGAGVQLGPNAAVGKNCVLDSRCIVANSVIFPGSYVGEMVEIKDAIADKNCLVNVRLGATVTVTEDFILGSMSERMVGRWLGGILARLMAIVLLALTWPILLATALWLKLRRGGPVLHKKECVRLPTSLEEREWRTFELWSFCVAPKPQEKAGGRLRDVLLRFLPGLVNVAKGEMRFVGVSPRDKEEIRQLPSDWRALYLRAKAGIVTEAVVVYGDKPTEDELYSAEAFYSASAGIGHDLKLLAAYLAHIFKGLGKRD